MFNLIVRSGISEAETTNNKRLRSTFCIEAIQTRSIARPLCDNRASCDTYWNKYSPGQGHQTINFGGYEVKDQGKTRPK